MAVAFRTLPAYNRPAMNRTARRFVAWVLLLALAWSSAGTPFATRLSPSEMAALGICSMAAHEAADNAGQPPQDDPGRAAAMQHCALCAPAAHVALLPSLPQPTLGATATPSFSASFTATHGRALYAGAIWRPRGPPERA